MRKLLILLETVTSSLRGAKRRGNRRCLEYTFENSRLDRTFVLEATGDRNKAALLSMNPTRKLLILLEPVSSSLRACCMPAYLGVAMNLNLVIASLLYG
jgi:hypothetical protein